MRVRAEIPNPCKQRTDGAVLRVAGAGNKRQRVGQPANCGYESGHVPRSSFLASGPVLSHSVLKSGGGPLAVASGNRPPIVQCRSSGASHPESIGTSMARKRFEQPAQSWFLLVMSHGQSFTHGPGEDFVPRSRGVASQLQAFVVPALRKGREGRSTHSGGDASEVKSLGRPAYYETRCRPCRDSCSSHTAFPPLTWWANECRPFATGALLVYMIGRPSNFVASKSATVGQAQDLYGQRPRRPSGPVNRNGSAHHLLSH